MSLVTRSLVQVAVYWSLVRIDEFGQPVLATTPVQVRCRWVDATEQVITPLGETRMTRAKVTVDRDMKDKEKLMLGALTSSTSHDPTQAGAWEIGKFEKNPDIRAREFLRTAWLI